MVTQGGQEEYEEECDERRYRERGMRRTIVCLILLLAGSAPLRGQDAGGQEPEVGARVRVWTASDALRPEKIVGTLVAVTPDHFTIQDEREGRGEVQVPREAVSRFEVSRRRHAKILTGLWVGAASGAIAGAVIGYAFVDLEDTPPALEAADGATIGVLSGALIGAITGTAIRVDHWESVELAVAWRGPKRGFGLSVSMRF